MRSFSYQLYSSRKFGDLDATLAMLSGLGYREVEGFPPLYGTIETLSKTHQALQRHGLRMPTAHFDLAGLEADPDRALDAARTLGVETVVVPYLAPEERPTSIEGWTAFGQRLAAAGRPIWEAGLSYAWHNHAFEFEPVDGALPMDAILAGSEDILVELDVAWVAVAGADPLEWIERFSDRLITVHIKDVAAEGDALDEDGWADVGHGTLDWPAIFGALEQTSAKHFIMEHDNPSGHERFARRSLETARQY